MSACVNSFFPPVVVLVGTILFVFLPVPCSSYLLAKNTPSKELIFSKSTRSAPRATLSILREKYLPEPSDT